MSQDISKIDKNLSITTSLDLPDVKFYDSRDEVFDIYGLYKPHEGTQYRRLPMDVASSVSDGVDFLSKQTAGGRLRFSTDSEYVAIKATLPDASRMSHMTAVGAFGFDLYEDCPPEQGKVSYYRGSYIPWITANEFEAVVHFESRKKRYFTINFPLYGGVGDLYIGLQNDATLEGGRKYSNKRPVMYYGSSITQGGCASRPGNSYQGFVSRTLDLDFINFGFSGSGKAEEPMVDYLCSLDMSVFVADYDHNAPDAEYLASSALNMYKKLRAAKPDMPYVMMSRPDFYKGLDTTYSRESVERRQAIIDVYNYARAQGDKNVYFIDGEGIFRGDYEDCCTVDGCHPNDLGFSRMAKVVEAALRRIMMRSNILD